MSDENSSSTGASWGESSTIEPIVSDEKLRIEVAEKAKKDKFNEYKSKDDGFTLPTAFNPLDMLWSAGKYVGSSLLDARSHYSDISAIDAAHLNLSGNGKTYTKKQYEIALKAEIVRMGQYDPFSDPAGVDAVAVSEASRITADKVASFKLTDEEKAEASKKEKERLKREADKRKADKATTKKLNKDIGVNGVYRGNTTIPGPEARALLISGGEYTVDGYVVKNEGYGANSLQAYIDSGIQAPLRDREPGFAISRKDPTRASIVVSSNWDSDEGGRVRAAVTNFILISATESRSETYRIVETFGEDVFYALGESPIVANFGGELLKGKGSDWKTSFEEDYENILRASKCVETNTRIYLSYENKVIEGFMLNFNTSSMARSPNSSPFSFSMYVAKKSFIGE